MTRIVEHDNTVITGYILEKKHDPVEYIRIRRFEPLVDEVSPGLVLKGERSKRIGFGTDIIFVDDIKTIQRLP